MFEYDKDHHDDDCGNKMDSGNNANGLSLMSSSFMGAGKWWIMLVACVYVFYFIDGYELYCIWWIR